jgi:hypothetical protein
MSWTVAASGTQAASIGTEHALATDTTNTTFAGKWDLSNMVNGDIVELRMYTKVLTGSGLVCCFAAFFAHVQAAPAIIAPPVPSDFSCKLTLKQTAGTGRNFDWSLLKQ